MLSKRTPGAPLSEAELRQRKEAARSRWEKAGIAAGAIVGGGASAYGAHYAASRYMSRKLRDAIDRRRSKIEALKIRLADLKADRLIEQRKRDIKRSVHRFFAEKENLGRPYVGALYTAKAELDKARETLKSIPPGSSRDVVRQAKQEVLDREKKVKAIERALSRKANPPTFVTRRVRQIRKEIRRLDDFLARTQDDWEVPLAERRKAMADREFLLAQKRELENARPVQTVYRKEAKAYRKTPLWQMRVVHKKEPKDKAAFANRLSPEELNNLKNQVAAARKARSDVKIAVERYKARIKSGEFGADEIDEAVKTLKNLVQKSKTAEQQYEDLSNRYQRALRSQKIKRTMSTVTVRPNQRVGEEIGSRAGGNVRLPSSLNERLKRDAKSKLINEAEDKRAKVQAFLRARRHQKEPEILRRLTARAKKLQEQHSWKVRAAVGGAALAGAALGGLAGRYLFGRDRQEEGLEKADGSEDGKNEESTPESDLERALAERLGMLFASWKDDPQKVNDKAAIERAFAPAKEAFKASAVIPPGGKGPGVLPPGSEGRRILYAGYGARAAQVEAAAAKYAADRVREVSDTAKDSVRRAIVEGAQRGEPVETTARRIRETVGLTAVQMSWVETYRRQLETLDPNALTRALRDKRFDRPIKSAIESGTPLPQEAIDRYVAAYHRRVLAYRALTIARTEGLRAPNLGAVAGVRAFLQQNPDYDVEKRWIATKDERTRDMHRELDGKVVIGLETPFECRDPKTGMIRQIRYPHDELAEPDHVVNCRCTLGIRIIPRNPVERPVKLK